MSNINLVENDFLLFFSDTNLYAVVRGEDIHYNHIPSAHNFSPISCLKKDSILIFCSKFGERIIQIPEQDYSKRNIVYEVVELDKKHKGKWINPDTESGVLNLKDNYLYILSSGGHPGYDESKIAKHLSKTPVLSCFDSNGNCLKQFGKFDSSYSHSGLEWAKKLYGAYDKSKDEYYIGSYLTPSIQNISITNSLSTSFGESPKNYNNDHFIVKQSERYSLGYHPNLASFGFKEIIIDTDNNVIVRLFKKPNEDEVYLNWIKQDEYKDFIEIKQKKKTKNACPALNPILTKQAKLLLSSPIYCQIYSLQEKKLVDEIVTPMKLRHHYIGMDDSHHYIFWESNKNIVTIKKYLLINK